MTKEQKILVLLILLVAGGGAALYVTTVKTSPKAESVAKDTTIQTGANIAIANTENSAQGTAIKDVQVETKTVGSSVNTAPSTISIPYTSEQTYNVPEDSHETIKVTLYVKSGVVEDVVFSFNPPSKRESTEYLSSFKKALAKADIKGKKVSDINLSRVGGASLTTAAFMKAVQEINGKTRA